MTSHRISCCCCCAIVKRTSESSTVVCMCFSCMHSELLSNKLQGERSKLSVEHYYVVYFAVQGCQSIHDSFCSTMYNSHIILGYHILITSNIFHLLCTVEWKLTSVYMYQPSLCIFLAEPIGLQTTHYHSRVAPTSECGSAEISLWV